MRPLLNLIHTIDFLRLNEFINHVDFSKKTQFAKKKSIFVERGGRV